MAVSVIPFGGKKGELAFITAARSGKAGTRENISLDFSQKLPAAVYKGLTKENFQWGCGGTHGWGSDMTITYQPITGVLSFSGVAGGTPGYDVHIWAAAALAY